MSQRVRVYKKPRNEQGITKSKDFIFAIVLRATSHTLSPRVILNLCIAYGSRDDITTAVERCVQSAVDADSDKIPYVISSSVAEDD